VPVLELVLNLRMVQKLRAMMMVLVLVLVLVLMRLLSIRMPLLWHMIQLMLVRGRVARDSAARGTCCQRRRIRCVQVKGGSNKLRSATIDVMQVPPHTSVDATVVRSSLHTSSWLSVVLQELGILDGAWRLVYDSTR